MAGGGQPNKFWKKVHRSTRSRIAMVLIYTLLEWTLIFLLLLHGFFSYLLTSFATHFALRPPCVLCTRVDHLFDPAHRRRAYRDLLCRAHMAEISTSVCEDCSASAREAERCSSCGGVMESEFFEVELGGGCSLEELGAAQFGAMRLESRGSEKIESCRLHAVEEVKSPAINDLKTCEALSTEGGEMGHDHDSELGETAAAIDEINSIEVWREDTESTGTAKVMGRTEEKSLSIPAETLGGDSLRLTAEIAGLAVCTIQCDDEQQDKKHEDKEISVKKLEIAVETVDFQLQFENVELTLSNEVKKPTGIPSISHGDETGDHEEANNKADCMAIASSKVCCRGEPIQELEIQELAESEVHDHACLEATPSTEISDENRDGGIKSLRLDLGVSCHGPECHDGDEPGIGKFPETPSSVDGVPETPTSVTSVDDVYHPHKRFMLASVDTGVVSEMDEVSTVDQLKSALKTQRQALSSLYAELEEERNASAIAANHTMAMITRLQEEKSAMQMEALQYQRMMEEQSEYDQEALQLLNDLMVKRERENQELERELGIYQKKVIFYEEKERQRIKSARVTERSATSSESCSTDGSDDLSTSLDGSEDTFGAQATENTTCLVVENVGVEKGLSKQPSTLDESLADFEKERLSILDHLKELEEKLFLVGDNRLPKDIERIDHLLEEHVDLDYSPNDNEFSNSISVAKQHLSKRRLDPEGKNLLPLFDASLNEDENTQFREDELPCSLDSLHMKISIEEELHNVYERLYALEADREFLRHSISSLKKGDKGMDLLLEILQHLRDLRSIELRDQSICEALG